MKIYQKIILALASLGMLIGLPAAQAFTSPVSRTNNAGTTATFSVSGVVEPAQYQWVHNGTNLVDSTHVIGSSSNPLTLSNVFGADAGAYLVIVSNSSGVVTSDVATLTVIEPIIATQPAHQVGKVGLNAGFSVNLTGSSPFSYQWRREGVPLAGATASTLSLTNLQGSNAGNYDVVVTNMYGSTTSVVAMLTINLAYADSFRADADSDVRAIALQQDGKILVGGDFFTLAGVPRLCLGRLNPDGTADPSFNPSPNTDPNHGYPRVFVLAVQPDRKILVAGLWYGDGVQLPRLSRLWRLDENGKVDPHFKVFTNGEVWGIAVNPDGSIWIDGAFTTDQAPYSTNLARLHNDGTVDTNFGVSMNSGQELFSLAPQPDGKLLVGGSSMVINGFNANALARLNADGTVDTNFAPNIGRTVYSLLLQPDNKILVGGRFGLGGVKMLARLNSNGSLDTNFSGTNVISFSNFLYPSAGLGYLNGVALQADGRILCCGSFNYVGTFTRNVTRNYLARMNPDGSLDPTFDPDPNTMVNTLLIQPDGGLLVGGGYGGFVLLTNLSGASHTNFGRLAPTSPATQNLSFDDSSVTWLRGGTSPEIWRATFEVSTNGADWNFLGNGTWITNGWQLTGVNIPTNTLVRARGFVSSGFGNDSSWSVDTIGSPFTQPLIAADGGGFGVHGGAFGFNVIGQPGQVIIIEGTMDFSAWTPVQTNVVPGSGAFQFNDASGTVAQRYYRTRVF